MNYRHAYHAGNFADVFKHAILALCLEHFKTKDKPFFVLDTHAGIGRYDLSGIEAGKTGEWQDGIGRLQDAATKGALSPVLLDALRPYLDAVAAENPAGGFRVYPGSPCLSQHLLRDNDRLFLCELHAEDEQTLWQTVGRDKRVKVEHRDGYEALKAVLPPKERRGMVLIDPPFEQPDEFDAMERALADGVKRWASGCFALWYPIKDRLEIATFHAHLETLDLPETVALDFYIRDPQQIMPGSSLIGCGYVLVNPPYGLMRVIEPLMDGLLANLRQDTPSGVAGKGAFWRLQTLKYA